MTGSETQVLTSDLGRVHKLAQAFRRALESGGPRVRALPSLERFPLGSCGEVAPLLGAYLRDRGCGGFDYVLGERGGLGLEGPTPYQSHAWLARGGLVVDITADQFKEVDEPVIVTTASAWHASFRQRVENPADYRIYDPHTVARLEPVYRTLAELADREEGG